MAKPVLVVVADEDTSLQALTRELESRYGVHYQVVSSSSAEMALARLAELKAAGRMCHWCWPSSGCRV
jgi:CheY-like chemotaxis protein